jgi:copper chaperone
MSIRTYSVPTISCGHCQQAIEGEVNKLPDVRLVEVDVASRTVLVEGDAGDGAIRAAIEEAGYVVADSVS